LAGFGCVIASNALNTMVPKFIGQGIDALATSTPIEGARRAAIWLALAALVGGVLRYGMRQLLNSVSRRVEFDLRRDLFAKLMSLPPAYFDRTPTGDLMARATNDLLAARMVAGPALMYLVDTATRTAILLPMMIAVNPVLAVLAILPLLALPALEGVLGRRIHDRSLAIQDHFGQVTEFVRQHLTGIRIVRAYSQETPESVAFARLNQEYAAKNLRLARVQAALDPLLMLLGGLSGVVVLLVGGRLVLSGTISTGAFVSFFVFLALLVWPLVFLGWAVNLVFRGTAAMSRINGIFREPVPIADPAAPVSLPPNEGSRSVRFEEVWFRFPSAPGRDWVLAGVSFDVPAGRSLGIVGRTGAGKTALVELIARLYDPVRGRILIDGVDLRQLSLADVRGAVGLVPQETFLFSDTVRHNVLLGAPDDGRLERAARISRLDAALGDLPNGYDTILGERGINLSGGQRQRAAIARALARDPPILILDDALSAVDGQTESQILAQLRAAVAGQTCIIVSHRAAAVRESDEILVLDSGRVVERGTYQELLARGGRFTDLVRTQLIEEELERL
jgi:ATP-binding cassette subfamily B protein